MQSYPATFCGRTAQPPGRWSANRHLVRQQRTGADTIVVTKADRNAGYAGGGPAPGRTDWKNQNQLTTA